MPDLFSHPAFDNHERVVFVHDQESGLRAIISLHHTGAGPASGGVRFQHYDSEHEALTDVLRLSKGMSYKSAMAGLPLGGGKSVILADANGTKTVAMLLAFARAVEQLNGHYIAAEDVGMTASDMAVMRQVTRHVAGLDRGRHASGDPSPMTAHGVFLGLNCAAKHRLQRDLSGLRIGILGLGAVGMKLATLLHEAGADLLVADIDHDRSDLAKQRFNATPIATNDLVQQQMDIFAPCALGGILSQEVAETIQASVIAGAANNQLLTDDVGNILNDRGILYAPDYVINAGGIINVAGEIAADYRRERALAALACIPSTLSEIFAAAEARQLPTNVVADQIARSRLAAHRSERQAA